MRPITASDLMNPEVLTVREDMTVVDLAAFLVDNEITGAPVVDEGGRLVGVVSVVDIAEAESEGVAPASSDFYEQSWEEGLSEEVMGEMEELEGDLLVADIMTPAIYSVDEESTVSEIASTMLGQHLHRVLVTRGEKVVGIITTSDLLGLLVEER